MHDGSLYAKSKPEQQTTERLSVDCFSILFYYTVHSGGSTIKTTQRRHRLKVVVEREALLDTLVVGCCADGLVDARF